MGIKIRYLKNKVIEGQPWMAGAECTVLPHLAISLLREGSAEVVDYKKADKVEAQIIKNIVDEVKFIKSKKIKDGSDKG
jgi:hypothetical protein